MEPAIGLRLEAVAGIMVSLSPSMGWTMLGGDAASITRCFMLDCNGWKQRWDPSCDPTWNGSAEVGSLLSRALLKECPGGMGHCYPGLS